MKFQYFQYTLIAGFLSLLFASCIKDDYNELTDEGESFVKILEAPEKNIFFSPFTDVQTVDLFSLRKEAANEGALNTTSSVRLTMNPALITQYNTDHRTDYQVLPDSLYTLADPSMKVSATDYKFDFTGGQFAKELTIKLNGAKWDLSRRYAMAFTIADSSGLNVADGTKDVIVFLSIKNQYDGIYSVESGTVTRYTAPGVPAGDALSGPLAGNPDVILATSGPNSLSVPPAGAVGSLQWAVGNNSSVAGIDGLRLVIDPVTNLVTVTSAGNATLTNWAGKENRYDPATKTFYLGFRWNPTSSTREYEVVLKYKGPR